MRTCELKNSDNLCVCPSLCHHVHFHDTVLFVATKSCAFEILLVHWDNCGFSLQIHFICSFGWFSPFKKLVPNIFSFWGQFLLFCDFFMRKKEKNLEKSLFNF